MDVDELVFKQEQESRKVGHHMVSGYSQDEGTFFGTNFYSPGINKNFIDNDSYVKGLGHQLKSSFAGQTIKKRDDAPNLLFKSSDFVGNTNDTRTRKSCNDTFESTMYNWSPNILGSDIQSHIQYDIGTDTRQARRT